MRQVSEVDAEKTKAYASQSGVGGSDLLRRPSKTRSHMTASPLILTPGNLTLTVQNTRIHLDYCLTLSKTGHPEFQSRHQKYRI